MTDPLDQLKPPNPTDNRTEPLLLRALIVALATAILALVVAFGLPLTDDQREAIIGVIAVTASLVTALWARRHVTSPARVNALLAAARTRRRV